MMATVLDSEWINGLLGIEWLTECSHSALRDRAMGTQRLLRLDSYGTHLQVSFLLACWDPMILRLILAADINNAYRPLHVDVFNELKSMYTSEVSL